LLDGSSLLVFVGGVAAGAAVLFFTGFLKRAGEDAYGWLMRKLNIKTAEATQVVVQDDPRPEQSQALAQAPVQRVSKVTYREILDAIHRAPPFQERQVAESYVGIRVEWDTLLKSGYKTSEGRLRLSLEIPGGGYAGVLCEVSEADYKELTVLPKDTSIRVSGEIAKASGLDVELRDVRLQIR
jgi:hypothetical protein